ncbi:hypothetical protein IFO69_15010 [Echinicola sp. CAU 1574]|uniref:Major capsid protein n=1 Tax=Echinicola arenosa TaxID=2774144 RepID=A0ABR9AMM9_9BACT|nr:hypothetical protein [Echinicola arenosa]MBD8490065.1 hypothetical protein [Echinicola arenosa]
MAQQTSIITLNGTVGGLSFYKTKNGYFARAKGGVSKSRVMTDPKYARTRENLREFSTAADGAKLFRDSMREALLKSSDPRFYNRVYSKMLSILKTDPVNSRGDRQVHEGDWNQMAYLELNAQARLESTLAMQIGLTDSASALEISLADFMPRDYVAIPEGSTHFRVFAVGVSVDFTNKARTSISSNSGLLPIGDAVTGLALTLDKSSLVEPFKAYVLGVEFVQEVNGQEYAMNNGAHNAAAVLLVESV